MIVFKCIRNKLDENVIVVSLSLMSETFEFIVWFYSFASQPKCHLDLIKMSEELENCLTAPPNQVFSASLDTNEKLQSDSNLWKKLICHKNTRLKQDECISWKHMRSHAQRVQCEQIVPSFCSSNSSRNEEGWQKQPLALLFQRGGRCPGSRVKILDWHCVALHGDVTAGEEKIKHLGPSWGSPKYSHQ